MATRTDFEVPRGIAARTAMWSARHRTLAIGGWLLFVVAVVVLAGQLGTVQATDADLGNGESARANRIIEAAGFPEHAAEMVLVQSGRVTADDPAFRAAVADGARCGRFAPRSSPAHSAKCRAHRSR